jgi:hypothetical protein
MPNAEPSEMAVKSPPSADKLRSLTPEILRRNLLLAPEHLHLIVDCPTSRMLLDRLSGLGLLAEAARLIGYALPEREAVWWACMCVSHTAATDLAPEQQAALAAAEDWVWRPGHETRRRAARAALAAGPDTPAAWTSRAAFASHPPFPPHLRCGRRIERAIAGATIAGETTRTIERLGRFIASGRDIARGGAGHLPPRAG